ncbi:MAG: hypothetical protein Tsb002_23460 [Wenzhouxiangellaceae bacterium]
MRFITAGLTVITSITPRDDSETGHYRADGFILSVGISNVAIAFADVLCTSSNLSE